MESDRNVLTSLSAHSRLAMSSPLLKAKDVVRALRIAIRSMRQTPEAVRGQPTRDARRDGLPRDERTTNLMVQKLLQKARLDQAPNRTNTARAGQAS